MAERTTVRMLAVVAALAIAATGCSGRAQGPPTPPSTPRPGVVPAPDAEQCPVTIANGNGPPGELPSSAHHGNGRLWTDLPPGGIDRAGTAEPGGAIGQSSAISFPTEGCWQVTGRVGATSLTFVVFMPKR